MVRSSLLGALSGILLVVAAVLALVLYEAATGGAFFAERGGASPTLIAQFVLLATPMGMAAVLIAVPLGAAIGWVIGRRRVA
ncbi:MAG: hypothetical protein AAGK21_17740 [Bacteroidota bacterium]